MTEHTVTTSYWYHNTCKRLHDTASQQKSWKRDLLPQPRSSWHGDVHDHEEVVSGSGLYLARPFQEKMLLLWADLSADRTRASLLAIAYDLIQSSQRSCTQNEHRRETADQSGATGQALHPALGGATFGN